MLDTIHIIDEYLAKPKQKEDRSTGQNFTMPGRGSAENPAGSLAVALTKVVQTPPSRRLSDHGNGKSLHPKREL